MDISSISLLDKLEECAHELSGTDSLDCQIPRKPGVLDQLDRADNWLATVLLACQRPSEEFANAANWILDNDYHVRHALRCIGKDLPDDFYQLLPRLADHRFAGLPRAYRLVHALLAHTELQLTENRLQRFLIAYQRQSVLSEAELWALPTLLRIASIENLMLGVKRLLDSDEVDILPDAFIVDYACADDTTHVSGAITTLTMVSRINWPDFIDEVSEIEARLRHDPGMAYSNMNQTSRIAYRREIEKLSRRSELSELQISDTLLELSGACENSEFAHIGYWLVGAGKQRLYETVNYRVPLKERVLNLPYRYTSAIYAITILTMCLFLLGVPSVYLLRINASTWQMVAILLLSLVPAIDIAVQFVHWVVPRFIPVRKLYSLDRHTLKSAPFRCALAVPVIVKHADEVEGLIENLELRYLANTERFLQFVLLSDPGDAHHQRDVEDDAIESALVAGIRRLNERYSCSANNTDASPGEVHDRFLLLHRSRQYNFSEGCWMAWERKRGKIEQFNELLTSGVSNPFTLIEGDLRQLEDVKYVISLDADTMLPPGSAAELVATFEHPLNQPVIDECSGSIVSGYTILQPRIETLEAGEAPSRFTKLYAGDSAIDIYSHAVSDFYQDWFGEGSYVGKGIYHVASFHASLAGRVPENRILSHDLFEGLHGRVALMTHITLYESFPKTWAEHCERRHRWIRGDWQLLSWIGQSVPDRYGSRTGNKISALGRWKLLDNLRRSISAPFLLIYLLGAWFVFPGSTVFWTCLAVSAFAPYLVNEALTGLALVSRNASMKGYWHEAKENLARWAVSIALIVPDSAVCIDAIAKSLWRHFVTEKNLLQWRSAAHSLDLPLIQFHKAHRAQLVWLSPMVAILTAIALFRTHSAALILASPVLLSWLLAPLLVVWLSKPRAFRRDTLTADDQQYLRCAARKTWHYFERFAGPEDNWLPPDNYQAHASVGVAHRTSPTNIGLYLTSALGAYDLGFIGPLELAVRIDNLLDSVDQLATHRSQLLNWYDTRTLEPLEPRYVSTVDNGNLAISLIAIKHGCLDAVSAPLLCHTRWQGLVDSFSVMRQLIDELMHPLNRELLDEINAMDKRLRAAAERQNGVATLAYRCKTFPGWSLLAKTLNSELSTADEDSHSVDRILNWIERVDHQMSTLFRDAHFYLPWLSLLDDIPSACKFIADMIEQQLGAGYSLSKQAVAHEQLLLAIEKAQRHLDAHLDSNFDSNFDSQADAREWLTNVDSALKKGFGRQSELMVRLRNCADKLDSMAWKMDFSWLFDRRSHLFHIGYNVSSGVLDANHYDLLASESRMASYFAIAKHDVPLRHWFALGRPVNRQAGLPVLGSWNGSMFEYLMPALFLPGKTDTLIGESESLAVLAQQQYAGRQNIPWGVSESAFGVCDAQGNFQYKAFGTPGLGIRRGLDDDSVIAPYASMLALAVWPKAAVDNLRMLQSLGAYGDFGFVDALDYTPVRLVPGEQFRIVDTWMAHHQGMSMVAIINVLNQDLMSRRVLQEPSLQAVQLLLQERVPWGAPAELDSAVESELLTKPDFVPQLTSSWRPDKSDEVTDILLLGNGCLSSYVSSNGGGGLYFKDLALTRVSADRRHAHAGYRIHVSDIENTLGWWVGSCTNSNPSADVSTTFAEHSAEFVERVPGLTVRMEVTVAASENIEVRRIALTNEEPIARKIALTSYAELVLSLVGDDERHPAFNKLFVCSRAEPEHAGISFTRQSREPEKHYPTVLHRVVSDDPQVQLVGYETDRHRWYGHHRKPLPDYDEVPSTLTGTTGWVLDPIMSLRALVTLDGDETRTLYFVTSVSDTRGDMRELALHYECPALERFFIDAPRIAAQTIARLGIDNSKLPDMQRLASLLLYPHAAMRSVASSVENALPQQAQLWRVGISGDLPLLLLRVHEISHTGVLDTLMRAQRLWRQRALAMDIGVFQLGSTGYEDPLRERILAVLRDTGNSGWLGRHGGVHIISMNQLSLVSQQSILASAAIIIDTDRALHERLNDVLVKPAKPPLLGVTGTSDFSDMAKLERPDGLLFDNGLGGFDPSTSEYVIHLEPGACTPAPWCNILANESFGSMVSEAGLGSTWSQNSGEHRLSPWFNDPVLNPQGEQLWLRDEINGDAWTTCPQPGQQTSTVQVRHGFGYTSWTRTSHGLKQTQTVFVPLDEPVKVVNVHLLNHSEIVRRVTLTLYVDWVLEALTDKARTHVVCEYDVAAQAIVARNAWNNEFAERVAFVSASRSPHSVCGDRSEFIGDTDQIAVPSGLLRSDLGGRFTPGSDSCAAYQIHLDIAPGSEVHESFVIGEGRDATHARELVSQWKSTSKVQRELKRVHQHWIRQLSAVEVRSPDSGFDLMVNRWLLYQSVSSRLNARAGFYQAGGAYGFRDQLQDVLAIIASDPQRVRRQILLCAEHQFEEGDVLHWWHPPTGRGVRTRISDDFLWLAYVCARYVESSGDKAILDVDIPYLQSSQLKEDEHDRYSIFEKGSSGSLFDHCCRALQNGMRTGIHGLPLIDGGDWNDGMDRIGNHGRGESVWLAWFQLATISLMTPIALDRKEYSLASRWHAHASSLKAAVDANAWDGEWFVRAFDDDGKPWGSHQNDECRIDLLAQSWGVLAGFGEENRVVRAMQAAEEKLVDHQNSIVKLLSPSFEHTQRNPGYIKAYPPGIRENGGQYTHAAVWLGLAHAAQGEADKAFDIFNMINPINHTGNGDAVNRYAREPYVLAADVGGADPYMGRGGWTWYTGAAGWAWQLGVHGILGIEYLPGAVRLAPAIPSHWKEVELVLRSDTSIIKVNIENPNGRSDSGFWMSVDGEVVADNLVRFPAASKQRQVIIRLGED